MGLSSCLEDAIANKNRGEKTLKAKNRTYTLVYTTNAIAVAEEYLHQMYGRPTGIGSVLMQMGEGDFSMRVMRVLVMAGLLKHHGDDGLSPDDAGDVIEELRENGFGFVKLLEAVNDTLTNALGLDDEVPKLSERKASLAKPKADQDKPEPGRRPSTGAST